MKEKITEHSKGSDDEALLLTIFSELTVFGFSALVTFTISKLGLENLSIMVYGHKHSKDEKNVLHHILAQIDMVKKP